MAVDESTFVPVGDAMNGPSQPTDMHFTMGEPVSVGEPMLDRGGSVIGSVVSCTDDCGEAFHIVVRPLGNRTPETP